MDPHFKKVFQNSVHSYFRISQHLQANYYVLKRKYTNVPITIYVTSMLCHYIIAPIEVSSALYHGETLSASFSLLSIKIIDLINLLIN